MNKLYNLPSDKEFREFVEKQRSKRFALAFRKKNEKDIPLGSAITGHDRLDHVTYVDIYRFSSRKDNTNLLNHWVITKKIDEHGIEEMKIDMGPDLPSSFGSIEKISIKPRTFYKYLQRENGPAYGEKLPKNYRILLCSRKGPPHVTPRPRAWGYWLLYKPIL